MIRTAYLLVHDGIMRAVNGLCRWVLTDDTG